MEIRRRLRFLVLFVCIGALLFSSLQVVSADELLVENLGNKDVWSYYVVCRFLGQFQKTPSFRPHWFGDWKLAQSFVLPFDSEVSRIDLFLCRGSKFAEWEKDSFKPGEYRFFESKTKPGTTGVSLEIRSDENGKPGKNILSAKVNAKARSISAKGGFVRFRFAHAVSLKKGKLYWICLEKPLEPKTSTGRNIMYGVPASLKDEVGPKDWYPEGKAAERILPIPGKENKTTSKKNWRVMASHDYFFKVYGKPVKRISRVIKKKMPWGDRPVMGSDPVQIYQKGGKRGAQRLDIKRMIERLKAQNTNLHLYMIWHNPETDWMDLKLYLPEARKAGIDVWIYMVPPSETSFGNPKLNDPEPFKLDYMRWARELAKLSLTYPNLKAWVMDDFHHNTWLFTPAYIKKMTQGAKAINPDFSFLPLLYSSSRQVNEIFVKKYRGIIGGVVVAYIPYKEGKIKGKGTSRNMAETSEIDENYALSKIHEMSQVLGDIPLVLMPMASTRLHKMHYGVPLTEERLYKLIKIGLQSVSDGDTVGTIVYRPNLILDNYTFKAVKRAYTEFIEETKQ